MVVSESTSCKIDFNRLADNISKGEQSIESINEDETVIFVLGEVSFFFFISYHYKLILIKF